MHKVCPAVGSDHLSLSHTCLPPPPAGYEVQTVRIATCSLQPPANYDTNSVLQHLSYLEGLCATNGVTLLAIGPFAASERNLSLIPKLLASTSISTSCSVALLPRPSRETALRVAACVMDVSRQTRGAGSFHFCVAANAPPHIPYFPVAYAADGGAPCFAVGTENDDVLFDAFQVSGYYF